MYQEFYFQPLQKAVRHFVDEETETKRPNLPPNHRINKLLSQDLSQFHPASKLLLFLHFSFENILNYRNNKSITFLKI